jgi:hypothetical protein
VAVITSTRIKPGLSSVQTSVRKHDFDMFQNTMSFHLTEIGAEIEEGLSADFARKILRS